MNFRQQLLSLLVIMLTALVVLPGAASASASAISQSFRIDTPVSRGSLVSLDSKQSELAHIANSTNSSGLLGVVIGDKNSLLAINPSGGTVQVAIGGTAPVLVSTLNGNISVGDLISVSPINGVGMKAQPGLAVLGRAQMAFSGDSEGAVSRPIVDKDSSKKNVMVGFVSVKIKINTDMSGSRTNGLQKIVQHWTGHTVSTIRIIIALAVAVVTLVALSVLIYASIFGSIISIGRNPLAKAFIMRSLWLVVGLALLLVVVSATIIAFLLH